MPLHITCASMVIGSMLYGLAYKAKFLYLILLGRMIQGSGMIGFLYTKRYCTDSRVVGIRRRTTLASWLVLGQGIGPRRRPPKLPRTRPQLAFPPRQAGTSTRAATRLSRSRASSNFTTRLASRPRRRTGTRSVSRATSRSLRTSRTCSRSTRTSSLLRSTRHSRRSSSTVGDNSPLVAGGRIRSSSCYL